MIDAFDGHSWDDEGRESEKRKDFPDTARYMAAVIEKLEWVDYEQRLADEIKSITQPIEQHIMANDVLFRKY